MITELNPPSLIEAGTEAENLTQMIRRAADSLAQATSAAEYLEAADQASIVYDAAKVASRYLKSKGAPAEMIAASNQLHGDALKIRAAALCHIANDYDAAQARGEVQKVGGDRKSIKVLDKNNDPPPAKLTPYERKLVHEARIVRDADMAEPHIVSKTVDEILKAGRAPQIADVKRATKKVLDQLAAARAPKQTPPTNQQTAQTSNPASASSSDWRSSDYITESLSRLTKDIEKIYMDERKEIVTKFNNLLTGYKKLAKYTTELAKEYEELQEEFNANVDQHNEMLDVLRAVGTERDELVDKYNALAERFNATLDEGES